MTDEIYELQQALTAAEQEAGEAEARGVRARAELALLVCGVRGRGWGGAGRLALLVCGVLVWCMLRQGWRVCVCA